MAHKRARALFSTEAEDSDELSFKANDILIILAKDVENTTGWWRCSLRDKTGLVPVNYVEEIEDEEANRKEADESVYDLPRSENATVNATEDDTYDALPRRNLPSNSDYDELVTVLPPKKKLTPKVSLSEGVYDLPTKRISSKNDDYDELPMNNNNNIVADGLQEDDDYDELTSNTVQVDGIYDVPTKLPLIGPKKSVSTADDYDIPKPSLDVSKTDDYDELPKSLASIGILPQSSAEKIRNSISRSSIASFSSTESIPLQVFGSPLTITNEEAMDKLIKLKRELDEKVTVLLQFLSPEWRSQKAIQRLNGEADQLKVKTTALEKSLETVIDFTRRTMATAANAGQKRCLRHINHLLQPVEEDAKIFGDMRVKLEKNAWKIESLADPKRDVQTGIPDDYDSFVITARAAPDDLASLANYVYTHAQSFFRRKNSTPSLSSSSRSNIKDIDDPRERPLPIAPRALSRSNVDEKYEEAHDQNDYDYIQLDEVRPSPSVQNAINSPRYNRLSSYKELPAQTEKSPSQERLLNFYQQFKSSQESLQQNMDRFIESAKDSPPQSLQTISKKIYKSATELVFLGDATSKVLESQGREDRVNKLVSLSNQLAETSTTALLQVDKAAQFWPATNELQTAVDLTAELSEHVRSLKHCIYAAISAS